MVRFTPKQGFSKSANGSIGPWNSGRSGSPWPFRSLSGHQTAAEARAAISATVQKPELQETPPSALDPKLPVAMDVLECWMATAASKKKAPHVCRRVTD